MALHPRISGDELRARIKHLGLAYGRAAERLGLTLDGLNKQMRGVNAVSRQTELLLGYLEKYPPPRPVRVGSRRSKSVNPHNEGEPQMLSWQWDPRFKGKGIVAGGRAVQYWVCETRLLDWQTPARDKPFSLMVLKEGNENFSYVDCYDGLTETVKAAEAMETADKPPDKDKALTIGLGL